jgi:hypothetical protein
MSLASRTQLFFEMRLFPQLALWAIDMPSASPTGRVFQLIDCLASESVATGGVK